MSPLACAALLFAAVPETPELKTFDHTSSVYFNDSLEEIALDRLELESMKRIGLDPNNLEDHRLVAFVIRGFHYRFYAAQSSGDFADLGIYAYNLQSVKIGQPVPVLDASSLENLPKEKIGAALHALFDPIRLSGEPRVMVAYARTRAGEEWWQRIFINAFASKKQFATSGQLTFTRGTATGGALEYVARPPGSLTDLDFTFDGERDGKKWHVAQSDVRLQVSERRKKKS